MLDGSIPANAWRFFFYLYSIHGVCSIQKSTLSLRVCKVSLAIFRDSFFRGGKNILWEILSPVVCAFKSTRHRLIATGFCLFIELNGTNIDPKWIIDMLAQTTDDKLNTSIGFYSNRNIFRLNGRSVTLICVLICLFFCIRLIRGKTFFILVNYYQTLRLILWYFFLSILSEFLLSIFNI